MARSSQTIALALLVAALVHPALAGEKEKPRPEASREALEAVEATVARAVDRVSLPHAAPLLGRPESARAYRLPGYGVVLVLTPRSLPGDEDRVYFLRGGIPKHRRPRSVVVHPATGEPTPADEEALETIERQVLVLQHETEAQRRAAEEDTERLLQEVRVRVAEPADVHVEVATPPAPPEPPAPDAAPGAAPSPLPAPPPWKFWFETSAPGEKRPPDAVVADVRGALVDALATGVRAAGLAGDERLTVTVDFVAGAIFAASARPEKTLVVTARARDVEARARGAITPEELKKRIEVTEY